jgi:hypothetical protein
MSRIGPRLLFFEIISITASSTRGYIFQLTRKGVYHREAVPDGGACSVSFHDVHRMEQSMGIGQSLLRNASSLLSLSTNLSDLDQVHMINHEILRNRNPTYSEAKITCSFQILLFQPKF